MKTIRLIQMLAVCTALTGCQRSTYDVWEDTKTCGRHINRGVGSLGGKGGDSRAVCCPGDFYTPDEVSFGAPVGQDYVPQQDFSTPGPMSMMETVAPQPRETPGDPGSSLPGIEAFQDPSTNPQLAGIFRNVQFDYNKYLIQGDDNSQTVHNVANYMKAHPQTYVFVEGHCDERGAEAFNQALGSRRANAVRNVLIGEGVNPDHIFSVSYGKERPLVHDHHEEAWSQNRRAEFKIYQR